METTAKRKRLYLGLGLLVALVLGVLLFWPDSSQPIRPHYTIRRLVAPGFESTQPQSINDHGQVIGHASNRNGGEGLFLWDHDGKATEMVLDVEGRPWFSQINNRGQALGELSSATRELYTFIWSASDGIRRVTSTKDDEGARAVDMNDFGELAGITWSEGKTPHATSWNANREAVRISDATSSWAWMINNRGTVFGVAYGKGPFLANAGKFRFLPWFKLGYTVTDMNDLEEVIGNSYGPDGSGTARGIIWGATCGVALLGQLNGYETEGVAINNKGQVVGRSLPQDLSKSPPWVQNLNAIIQYVKRGDWEASESTAFLWEEGQITPLMNLVKDPSDWISLSEATDINELGEIVGFGNHRGVRTGFRAGFVLTPIEESGED